MDPADEGLHGDRLRGRLKTLPLRALVAFALRCAKRVEVVTRYKQLTTEAYAAGLDSLRSWRTYAADAYAAAYAAYAADAHAAAYAADAAYAAADADAADAYAAAAAAAAYAAADAHAAAATDVRTLSQLNLGSPGEPGEPIRWDDPRLGPLWSAGPPAWHLKLEAMCHELEEKLRPSARSSEPPAEPQPELPDYVLSQLGERAWLDKQRDAGKLDRYRGTYVVAANRTILAHDRNLLKAREKAKKKADRDGIPVEKLANYFVPSA